MTEMTDAYQWQDRTIVGSDGEKIGKISEIYVDQESGRPEWATVSSGLFGTKHHFVPLAGASPDGEDVRARVTKNQVNDAPSVENDGELSEAEERRLFEHYDVPYTNEGSTTAQGQPHGGDPQARRDTDGDGRDDRVGGQRRDRGQPGTMGRDTSGSTTDDAMTRSEEELNVGTRRREAGRARLRKQVVTEMVTRTVPVQREEVTIDREPITDANRDQAMAGGELTDEDHEIVLHEDEVVVDKQVVPKERVRMSKQGVTEDQEVSEEVRKEKIETEGMERSGGRGGDRQI